jgi:hypothetical protein
MKRIIIFCFVLLSSIISNSQIESGRKYIGSTLSLSGYHNTVADNSFFKSAEFSVGINPRFGKFIRQNLAIGGALPLAYSREIYNSNSGSAYETLEMKTNSMHFGAEFFARIYQPLTDKFYVHVEANIGARHTLNYATSIYSYTLGSSTEFKTNSGSLTSRIALIPGLTYFAKPNLAFELNMGMLHFTNTLSLNQPFSNLSGVQNSYGLSFQGSTFSIGANFFF